MTLHKAGIIPFKHMWIIFIRNTAGFLQQGQYSHQTLDFLRFVLVPFQVLLEEEIGLSNGQYSNWAKDKLKEISSTTTSKENYTDKELKAFYDYLWGAKV